MRVWVFR